jgi:hypothetical protein
MHFSKYLDFLPEPESIISKIQRVESAIVTADGFGKFCGAFQPSEGTLHSPNRVCDFLKPFSVDNLT